MEELGILPKSLLILVNQYLLPPNNHHIIFRETLTWNINNILPLDCGRISVLSAAELLIFSSNKEIIFRTLISNTGVSSLLSPDSKSLIVRSSNYTTYTNIDNDNCTYKVRSDFHSSKCNGEYLTDTCHIKWNEFEFTKWYYKENLLISLNLDDEVKNIENYKIYEERIYLYKGNLIIVLDLDAKIIKRIMLEWNILFLEVVDASTLVLVINESIYVENCGYYLVGSGFERSLVIYDIDKNVAVNRQTISSMHANNFWKLSNDNYLMLSSYDDYKAPRDEIFYILWNIKNNIITKLSSGAVSFTGDLLNIRYAGKDSEIRDVNSNTENRDDISDTEDEDNLEITMDDMPPLEDENNVGIITDDMPPLEDAIPNSNSNNNLERNREIDIYDLKFLYKGELANGDLLFMVDNNLIVGKIIIEKTKASIDILCTLGKYGDGLKCIISSNFAYLIDDNKFAMIQ